MKINSLKIETKNIQEQFAFYNNALKLPVKVISQECFVVTIGYSTLIFQQQNKATPYHIAFHIPANFEEKALAWLKKRVAVETFQQEGENHEIIDFKNWNAKSVYFYDADKNILEFIARKDAWFSKSKNFSSKHHLIGIAEIGLATLHVKSAYQYLQKEFQLEKYDGDFKKFCAIGDDEGLLITIDKSKKVWFPTQDKAFSSAFVVHFQHKKKVCHLKFENNMLISV